MRGSVALLLLASASAGAAVSGWGETLASELGSGALAGIATAARRVSEPRTERTPGRVTSVLAPVAPAAPVPATAPAVLAVAMATAEEPVPRVTVSPPPAHAAEPPVVEMREPRLVATGRIANVYARPSASARRLGYLRFGAVVARSADARGYEGCEEGFYEIAPEGFVCSGKAASLDGDHPTARVAERRADRNEALPYLYALAPSGGAPVYTKVPTKAEQESAEPDLSGHRRRAHETGFEHVANEPMPWFLEGGKTRISTHGYRAAEGSLVERRMLPRSGYALMNVFEHEGRRFGLTAGMEVVPLDRVTRVEGSRFHGVPLTGDGLPVVFARSRKVGVYSGDPREGGLVFVRFLEFREGVVVTGRTARAGKAKYLEARSGEWVRDEHLVMAQRREALPPGVQDGARWIDVSIDRQTLVAYEGTRPVFATLVSTGKDGTGDPEKTLSTVQGEYRIHTKHVSITMDGDEVGDEFELNDVPYVQYFQDGYALHAAYWHDGFGAPRSHGCVNLSPRDARWLFGWTDPPVPTAWHGAMSAARGTLVSIHP